MLYVQSYSLLQTGMYVGNSMDQNQQQLKENIDTQNQCCSNPLHFQILLQLPVQTHSHGDCQSLK